MEPCALAPCQQILGVRYVSSHFFLLLYSGEFKSPVCRLTREYCLNERNGFVIGTPILVGGRGKGSAFWAVVWLLGCDAIEVIRPSKFWAPVWIGLAGLFPPLLDVPGKTF